MTGEVSITGSRESRTYYFENLGVCKVEDTWVYYSEQEFPVHGGIIAYVFNLLSDESLESMGISSSNDVESIIWM